MSREQVQTVTAENNTIKYYIDIHRDSARKENTTKVINGKSYAKLYFVVGQAHENYEGNLMFAKEMHDKLEKNTPV